MCVCIVLDIITFQKCVVLYNLNSHYAWLKTKRCSFQTIDPVTTQSTSFYS